jgi:hypothetical protein
MNSYKFVIALNKSIDIGPLLNATAHLSLSLAAQANPEEKEAMHFITYTGKNGIEYPSISALSLIVLRGSESELKKLSHAAREQKLLHAEFLQTMTGDTYVEQLERTKNTDEPIFYAVALFGKKESIDPLTKRLSLYK